MTLIKIIWCLLGLIGWFFTYHTVSKYWYFNSPEDHYILKLNSANHQTTPTKKPLCYHQDY